MNDKLKAARAAKRTAVIGILSGVAIFAYGLWISRSHITHIGYALKLSAFEAETLFVLVDFLALYGKLMTSKRLTAKARRFGFRVMLTGLAMSTACNVASGILHGSAGGAIYGLVVVVIIVIVEYGVSITKAKTVNTESRPTRAPQAPAAAVVNTRRCAPGCMCGKHKRSGVNPISPGRVPLAEVSVGEIVDA